MAPFTDADQVEATSRRSAHPCRRAFCGSACRAKAGRRRFRSTRTCSAGPLRRAAAADARRVGRHAARAAPTSPAERRRRVQARSPRSCASRRRRCPSDDVRRLPHRPPRSHEVRRLLRELGLAEKAARGEFRRARREATHRAARVNWLHQTGAFWTFRRTTLRLASRGHSGDSSMKTRSSPRHLFTRRIPPHLRAHASRAAMPPCSPAARSERTRQTNRRSRHRCAAHDEGPHRHPEQGRHDADGAVPARRLIAAASARCACVRLCARRRSVKMQVDGQPAVTLRLPARPSMRIRAIFIACRRMRAATQPAKILVFMVKDKDKPATRAAQ